MTKATLRTTLAAVLAAGLLSGGLTDGAVAQSQATKRTFAHIGVDAPFDPSVVYGVLPNGMRYAIMKNALPAGLVSMRFHFNAGSAHEAEDQLGLAHFVEHMAFNGSKKVKEDELFKIMERLGASSGPDTNAYTGQRETVYLFNVPSVDEGKIDTALMLFRETASELLIDPAAVDRERGVVLSEERGRASPQMRAVEANMKAMYPGHPLGRSPIGSTEILRTAPAQRIRDFWDAYYRPERATLVVVGDIDPAMIEAKIKEKFSDWKGRGPDGKDPPPVNLAGRGTQVEVYTETGLLPQAGLTWLDTPRNLPDGPQASRERVIEGMVTGILSRRFAEVAQSPNPPFLQGVAQFGEMRGIVRQTGVATGGATDVKGSIESLVRVQKQAVEHGFRQDEVDRYITNTRAVLNGQIAAAATRRSPALADSLLGAITTEVAFRTPQQTLDNFNRVVGNLTLAEVNAVLRQNFSGKGPYLFVMDGKPYEGGKDAIAQVLASARAEQSTALAAAEVKAWPYADFGPAGQIVSRKTVDDLGLTFVTFANGVRLTVKKTDFNRNNIQIRATFGGGLLDLPKDKVSPAMMFSGAFTSGGLNKLTVVERQRVTTGKQVAVNAGVGPEGFFLSGVTRPEDFEMQMQLLAAQIIDAAWSPPAFAQMMDANARAFETIDTQPAAVFGLKAPLLMHSNDQRFASPTPEIYRSANVAEIKALMAPIVAEADMEVVIVGDIDVETAIAQAAKTFGALPKRKPKTEPPGARDVKFAAPTPEPIKLTHRGRADQGIAAIAFPGTGYWRDPELSDQLSTAMAILVDRVNEEMRERQGKSYGVGGGAALSRTYPDYGELMVQTEISADVMPLFFETVEREAVKLATEGATQDEVDRAIRPRRENIARGVVTNAYWMGVLPGAQGDEKRLADIRRDKERFTKVTPASVKAAAQQWLVPAKAWKLTVVPQPAAVAAN